MFEEHRLARRQRHDVFHRIFNLLDETRRRLRILVCIPARLDRLAGFVPVIIMCAALNAFHIVQTDIEPDRRIERRVLIHDQPDQLLVEYLSLILIGEQAILQTPVSDRPGHAM